jgi:hypothetical protein
MAYRAIQELVMFKLVQKKNGKTKVLAKFARKIDAIYAHIEYSRTDRVFLEQRK